MRRLLLLCFLILTACGGSAPTPVTTAPPPPAAPAFANKAWRVVAPSDIPEGAIYVFLTDNTLLITAATGTPALGRWMMSGPELVMIEEGMRYRTEILESTPERLVLRQHNPGGTIKLVFAPARTLRSAGR